MPTEKEDIFRLRAAKEHLASCRERETEARKTLALAMESTARAKDKYETLFVEAENRQVARLKAADYRHSLSD